MGSIELRQFRRLAEGDIGDCLALSAQADWNQTAADWALFLRHGIVFANGYRMFEIHCFKPLLKQLYKCILSLIAQ